MAKSRPDKKNKRRKKNAAIESPQLSPATAKPLLEQAATLLQIGQPDEALPIVKMSLKCLSSPGSQPADRLPALEMLGEVYVELGDLEQARATFLEAVGLDPNGELPEYSGGGPDKFLWLAQLCEEGGKESVVWFGRGIDVLRRQLEVLDDGQESGEPINSASQKKTKLANALCGVAEVYMTDLSWEDDAETRCESSVTEACMIAPNSPGPLQTLASVRISQTRMEDARAALERSLGMWSGLPPEDPQTPDFPTRISLSRLLMEAELEMKALEVLERLVAEDDTSVEAWYLGGWCQYLIDVKLRKTSENSDANDGQDDGGVKAHYLNSSRDWLQKSLQLCALVDYEDDRLQQHAEELVAELNQRLGPQPEDDAEADEEEWEDEYGESD